MITSLTRFIKEHWTEGNWEVVLSIECLRDLIKFQDEPQKENQINILVEIEINFLKECLDNFKSKINDWISSDSVKLEKYYEDSVKKLKKDSAKVINTNLNKQSDGFWSADKPIMVPYKFKFYERIIMLMNDLVAGNNEATVTQIRKAFTLD